MLLKRDLKNKTEQTFICPVIKNKTKGKRKCLPLGRGVGRQTGTYTGRPQDSTGCGFDLEGLQ